MAEDPNHPWGSGSTTWHWTPEVHAVVRKATQRFPRLTANSYVCHPWCGWSEVSVDFWGPGGRGDPLLGVLPFRLRRYLMQLQGQPFIRHTIIDHQLWTSWGGYSYWHANDHTGAERHLHVTYWKGVGA